MLIHRMNIGQADSWLIDEISQDVKHHCELKSFKKKIASGNPL